MKKIYLFCSAGMSTSLLAASMQKAAVKHGLPVEVKAFPCEELETIYQKEHPECILLGPQMRFMQEEVCKKYQPLGAVVSVISVALYGAMDGEGTLRDAVKQINENNKRGVVL